MRQDAIELIRGVIIAKYDRKFNTNWELAGHTDPMVKDVVNGRGQPLINQGGNLMIMPFGERDTYRLFKLSTIQHYPKDFNTFFKFPFSYDQQSTFGEIAKAKAADIAIEANLKGYFLIVISGKGEDTNSRSYSRVEMDFLDKYRSAVVVTSLAIFRYRDRNIDYKIEISDIDVRKMSGSNTNPPQKGVIQSANVTRKELEIVNPQGEKAAPLEVEGEHMQVSWMCLGCEGDIEFRVRYTNLDTKEAGSEKVAGKHNVGLILTPGLYKVQVVGGGLSSKAVYIQMEGEGSGFPFLGLLIVAALVAVGIFVKKVVQSDDGQDDESRSPEHEFGVVGGQGQQKKSEGEQDKTDEGYF